jgi:hypothetical protein
MENELPWYVLRVRQLYEERVLRRLEAIEGVKPWLARYKVVSITQKRPEGFLRPAVAGMLFLQCAMSPDLWQVIMKMANLGGLERHTAYGFIGGEHPDPVPHIGPWYDQADLDGCIPELVAEQIRIFARGSELEVNDPSSLYHGFKGKVIRFNGTGYLLRIEGALHSGSVELYIERERVVTRQQGDLNASRNALRRGPFGLNRSRRKGRSIASN